MTTLEAPMENPVNQLIRLAVAEVAANWKSFVPRFFRFLRQLTKRKRSNALYEIIDYDLTLDLSDPTGALATFKRKQKVRFLQDHVIAYQDEAWGDGEVVAGYKCTPGVPVDMFKVGGRFLILISLRQTKNRNDVMEFNIERTVKDGFTAVDEWLEVETRYLTRRLRVTIIFPTNRPCREARLHERRGERTTVLGKACFGQTREGRQTLTWENKRPRQGEAYTITWSW